MTTTPTPRPVPTTGDRMRDATTPARAAMTFREARDAGLLPPVLALALPQDSESGTDTTDRTFATYLDRTERDQLDAKAACAQQERDEALDDRDAYKEARDVLRHQLDAMTQAALDHRKTASEALNAKYAALGQVARLRSELGAAGDVLAVVRDAAERIDRALAVYDTTPGEPAEREDTPHEDPARLREQLAEAHADCARYATERDEARAERDNAKAVVEAAKLWRWWHGNTNAAYADACQALEAAVDALGEPQPPALGSPPPRAQGEPEREEVRWAYRWIGPDGQVYDEMDATDNAIETAEQRAHRIAAKRVTGTVRGEVLRYRVLTMPAEVVATYPAEREG